MFRFTKLLLINKTSLICRYIRLLTIKLLNKISISIVLFLNSLQGGTLGLGRNKLEAPIYLFKKT